MSIIFFEAEEKTAESSADPEKLFRDFIMYSIEKSYALLVKSPNKRIPLLP